MPWNTIAGADETDAADGGVEPSAPQGRSYTWLHLVVLCVVGFVFGVVIYMLLAKGAAEPPPVGLGALAPVVAVVGG
jgi:lipopolysaccharide export LptBFGC system permease protein LptF